MRLLAVPALACLLAAIPACSSPSTVVAITATDSECRIGDEHFDAGKTTFEITNQSSQVAGIHVYAPGDKVVGEKKDIGPGASARLTADLAAGDYEVACKPGQQGDGIRRKIEVHGRGHSPKPTSFDHSIDFQARDFTFTGLGSLAVQVGEAVEFKMENKGTVEHEFEVLGPDGRALGEISPIKRGDYGEVILLFGKAGTYTYLCDIDNHESLGMKGTLQVR